MKQAGSSINSNSNTTNQNRRPESSSRLKRWVVGMMAFGTFLLAEPILKTSEHSGNQVSFMGPRTAQAQALSTRQKRKLIKDAEKLVKRIKRTTAPILHPGTHPELKELLKILGKLGLKGANPVARYNQILEGTDLPKVQGNFLPISRDNFKKVMVPKVEEILDWRARAAAGAKAAVPTLAQRARGLVPRPAQPPVVVRPPTPAPPTTAPPTPAPPTAAPPTVAAAGTKPVQYSGTEVQGYVQRLKAVLLKRLAQVKAEVGSSKFTTARVERRGRTRTVNVKRELKKHIQGLEREVGGMTVGTLARTYAKVNEFTAALHYIVLSRNYLDRTREGTPAMRASAKKELNKAVFGALISSKAFSPYLSATADTAVALDEVIVPASKYSALARTLGWFFYLKDEFLRAEVKFSMGKETPAVAKKNKLNSAMRASQVALKNAVYDPKNFMAEMESALKAAGVAIMTKTVPGSGFDMLNLLSALKFSTIKGLDQSLIAGVEKGLKECRDDYSVINQATYTSALAAMKRAIKAYGVEKKVRTAIKQASPHYANALGLIDYDKKGRMDTGVYADRIIDATMHAIMNSHVKKRLEFPELWKRTGFAAAKADIGKAINDASDVAEKEFIKPGARSTLYPEFAADILVQAMHRAMPPMGVMLENSHYDWIAVAKDTEERLPKLQAFENKLLRAFSLTRDFSRPWAKRAFVGIGAVGARSLVRDTLVAGVQERPLRHNVVETAPLDSKFNVGGRLNSEVVPGETYRGERKRRATERKYVLPIALGSGTSATSVYQRAMEKRNAMVSRYKDLPLLRLMTAGGRSAQFAALLEAGNTGYISLIEDQKTAFDQHFKNKYKVRLNNLQGRRDKLKSPLAQFYYDRAIKYLELVDKRLAVMKRNKRVDLGSGTVSGMPYNQHRVFQLLDGVNTSVQDGERVEREYKPKEEKPPEAKRALVYHVVIPEAKAGLRVQQGVSPDYEITIGSDIKPLRESISGKIFTYSFYEKVSNPTKRNRHGTWYILSNKEGYNKHNVRAVARLSGGTMYFFFKRTETTDSRGRKKIERKLIDADKAWARYGNRKTPTNIERVALHSAYYAKKPKGRNEYRVYIKYGKLNTVPKGRELMLAFRRIWYGNDLLGGRVQGIKVNKNAKFLKIADTLPYETIPGRIIIPHFFAFGKK